MGRGAVIAVLLWALVQAPSAGASGMAAPFTGTAWSGVTVPDPAALHWNPAMLGELSGVHLQVNAGLIYGRLGYDRERLSDYQRSDGFTFALPLDPSDVAPESDDPLVVGEVLSPTGSAFASVELIEGLSAGFGAYPAFAAAIQFPDSGPHQYHVQEALIGGFSITPALAWRPLPWLSIGAGLNLIVGTMGIRTMLDLAGTELLGDVLAGPPIGQPNDFGADAPPGVRELDVLSRQTTIYDAYALGAGFTLGLSVTPAPQWRLGLSYQHSVDLVFEGRAHVDMNHDFFTKDLAYNGLEYPAEVEGDAWIEMPVPSVLRLGVGWSPLPELDLHLMGAWVRHSLVDELAITIESEDLALPELGVGPLSNIAMPRRSQDAAELEFVAGYRLFDALQVGLRAGYHSAASPDQTIDLTSIDGHRIIAALMSRFALSESITLSAQATLHQLISREVVASDYDRGNGRYEMTLFGVGVTLEGRW